jgi:hypothetical protein
MGLLRIEPSESESPSGSAKATSENVVECVQVSSPARSRDQMFRNLVVEPFKI